MEPFRLAEVPVRPIGNVPTDSYDEKTALCQRAIAYRTAAAVAKGARVNVELITQAISIDFPTETD
jgi:hypothetical protein